jgi:hypothetical protein
MHDWMSMRNQREEYTECIPTGCIDFMQCGYAEWLAEWRAEWRASGGGRSGGRVAAGGVAGERLAEWRAEWLAEWRAEWRARMAGDTERSRTRHSLLLPRRVLCHGW